MAKRYQHVEHAILTLVLKHGAHQGYAATLATLANILRQTFPDIATPEIIDTIKRLEPEYIALRKYSPAHARLLQYSKEEIEDEYLFGEGNFCLQRTPYTDPQVQELELEIGPPEAEPTMTTPISDAGRKARFDRWEEFGLDRVKADLVHNGGRGEIGGTNDVRELAWEWVRMKEAEIAAATKQSSLETPLSLISETRVDELRALTSVQFDFSRLIRLCEEINTAYGQKCYFATAMLTRGLLGHVPPVFGKTTFNEVANNYGHGGKSFKETMQHLENAARKVADAHLHMPIRNSEMLPVAQQVNCASQLDVLLSEIVRLMK
jgi:hypothetical protein